MASRPATAQPDANARHVCALVLVVDTSGSMAGTKLDAARAAAGTFVGLMDLSPGADQVAIVRFDTDAEVVVGLSRDRAGLETALASLAARTGTYLDRGLDAALGEILGPHRAAGNEPVVVLLTDGVQTGTPGAELAAAERVRAAGVRLYTVGLGADADGPTLVAMAGESGRYYHAPGAAELEGVYRAIARDVACPAEGLWGHGGQGGGDRRRAAAR